MRLRNIPGARDVIAGHEAVIKNEKEQKGHWEEVFGNDHPVRVEIGMGKGRFLMTMALEHPEINYIGIERYSSVLLRALERMLAKKTELPVLTVNTDGMELYDRGEEKAYLFLCYGVQNILE